MFWGISWLLLPFLMGSAPDTGTAPDARQFVQTAVSTELAKDQVDHSHWLYFENDQKAEHPVMQWVAETPHGNLRRIIQMDGKPLPPEEQRQRLEAFVSDPGAQNKARKSEQHDDQQAAEMLQTPPQSLYLDQRRREGK